MWALQINCRIKRCNIPTSVYFQNYSSSREQQLYEDLIIEMIRIHGLDVFYLPRTLGNVDPVYTEDSTSSYNRAFMIEMYVKNSGQGFGGSGDIMDIKGLEITDTMTLVVARRVFVDEIGDISREVRPLEGDIVYFPFNKKVFKVVFVEHESIFYQMGTLQVWELKCELFEYSGETFNTGLPFIDNIVNGYNLNLVGTGLTGEDGGSLANEDDGLPILFEDYVSDVSSTVNEDNDYYQVEGEKIIDFSEIDPFSSGTPY